MNISAVDLAAVSALQDVVLDIQESMKQCEVNRLPNINTMDTQPEYQWYMRPQLLGFLVECQQSLGLALEAFSLAVNILDRYASRRVIKSRHHQLVGAVCLWIATKYMDNKTKAPTVREIQYLCAGAFNAAIICEMELHILAALDWEVAAPTAVEFVDLYVGQLYADQRLPYPDPAIYCALAKHLCECSLFRRELLGYLPSSIASMAVQIACTMIDVLCGLQQQMNPIANGDQDLFDAMVAFIVEPPSELTLRAQAYHPFNVVSLFSRFLMETSKLDEPAAFQEQQKHYESPLSSPSDWEFTSPATEASFGDSPQEYIDKLEGIRYPSQYA